MAVSITQSGAIRSMIFNNDCIQSAIDINQPEQLPLEANRAMLSHLLFGRIPQRVLLAGCGGGAIARWFATMSPQTEGVAVELQAEIASLAREFFDFPGATSNWSLQLADVRDYLQQTTDSFDFMLLDIEIDGAIPDWISAPDFLNLCRLRLSDTGVLTINLLARQSSRFIQALWHIRQAFPGTTYCLSSTEHNNIMVTAFRSAPTMDNLEQRAAAATRIWNIDFNEQLQRIRKENLADSGIF